ncbi:unnamed protein product [Schistocephalus solidus]|uniref:GAR domain-containing protein n=1 Tax=Schistocephalus solidus TaxID=70667 RepID=A0A183SMI1_SCHSO|nr:unnamed protein product [Schistocephalus solidus]
MHEVESHAVSLEQLFPSTGTPAETGVQPHSSKLPDLERRFKWLRLCTHTRLETARKHLKTKLAQEESFESLQRTVSRMNERLTAIEWSLTEQAAYEKVFPAPTSPLPPQTEMPVFDPIPEALETTIKKMVEAPITLSRLVEDVAAAAAAAAVVTAQTTGSSVNAKGSDELECLLTDLKITLPEKIEALRSRCETHLTVTSRLLRTCNSLKDLVEGLKTSVTERLEQVDILLVGSDIARLNSEEWTTSHRRALELELEGLSKLAADLSNSGLVTTHLEATNSALESYLASLRDLTGLSTPSSPIQLLLEGQLTNLTVGLQHDRSEVARTMECLRDQLTRGDVYQAALLRCQEELTSAEREIEAITSTAPLEGPMDQWVIRAKHIAEEITQVERHLCDFQNSDFETLLISSGVRIETGFDSNCLPFPIQAVHESWSELINRAMNVRGSAEAMVDSIQEMTAAFASTVDWLKETKKRLMTIIEIPPQMPFALTGTETETDATADYIDTLQPPFLVHIWSGLLETRSFRSSRISVGPLPATTMFISSAGLIGNTILHVLILSSYRSKGSSTSSLD